VDLSQISVGNMNAQAAYLVPSATLLMILYSHQRQSRRKWLLLLGLSVIAMAILATSSRGAMIALIVVVGLGIIIDRRLWQVALPASLVAVAALLALPHTLVERLEAMVTLSDRGAGRVDIWLVALRIIRSHPALGVGLDGFAAAFDRYLPETAGIITDIGTGRASHNIFLNVQSELGVIGSVLFLLFIGVTLRSGLAAVANWRRAGSVHWAGLALAAWLSLVAMLVMGLFLDLQYWKLFWMLLALPEVMRRLSVEALLETPA
jgi:O-antigen ligase